MTALSSTSEIPDGIPMSMRGLSRLNDVTLFTISRSMRSVIS